MNRKAPLRVLGALTLVLGVGVTAEAQLAKQGTYRGTLGARAVGTTHEIEKGHVFFVGGFNGMFFNAVANGFLDNKLTGSEPTPANVGSASAPRST